METQRLQPEGENNKGRSEGEARTFDCTFWLNNPGGRRVAGLMRFVFDRL
jgi:hypothetical protein